MIVYGTSWCGDCIRTRSLLDRRGTVYRWIDIDEDQAAAAKVADLNRGNRSVPTIVFEDGSILVEPSNDRLTAKLEALGL